MASFVIHTIAGEMFLKTLMEEYNIKISDEEYKKFLLGNLIVDSLSTSKVIPSTIKEEDIEEYKLQIRKNIRKEKVATHFRNPSNENLCIKSPVPERFIDKYSDLLKKDISVLGYLFHLYTDSLFFNKLFPETFEMLDINYKTTIYDKDLTYIRIKKNGNIIPSKQFWAGTSNINIYDDYTTMNKLLIEHFGITFNSQDLQEFVTREFTNPGIEEVNYQSVSKIISDTSKYIDDSNKITTTELQVFSSSNIIEFIPYVVKRFMLEYKTIIDEFIGIKRKIKR